MELTFSVLQRRRARAFEWFTLGLGRFDQQRSGANLSKVQAGITEALGKALGKVWPQQLEELEMVPGRQLRVVTLSISTGGRRIHGAFPVVLEPRPRGPGETMTLVYHPLRTQEWFELPPGEGLAERAATYFRTCWGELSDDELEDLRAHPRDRLRVVSMTVRTKRLHDALEEKKKDEDSVLTGGGRRTRGRALLGQLGVDETRRAIAGGLPAGMARSPLRERLGQLLGGVRRVSVLLVGPAGSGKSTLVRQLVHDLLLVDDYPSHHNYDRLRPVFRLAGRRIIAGMSYLGQWEQRCVDVVDAAREARALLWVEDVHAWGRLGETQQSDRNLATFFRGPVARGELAMVAECSAEQHQQLQDDAPGLAAALTTLFVEPTDEATTLRMLLHEARALELRHRVAFEPRALRTVYELGAALGSASAQPGRSIELLRHVAGGDGLPPPELHEVEQAVARDRKIEAISLYRSATGEGLLASKRAVEAYISAGRWPRPETDEPPPLAMRSRLAADFGEGFTASTIGPRTVVRRLAQRTGLSEALLSADRPLSAERVRVRLSARVMGQGAAVEAMVELVLRIKAGLTDPARPWGVVLFTGPTGTGKTELAKVLAAYLYGSTARLVRFDMSEFSDPGAPARLIGDRSAPEGVLTSRVRLQPFSVVLLDEVEKAHPAVLALMLQLFDDGRLTDATGALVDFTHTVVVMTSNLGARAVPPAGFGGRSHAGEVEVAAAVRAFFPPELFNRIDRVVPFSPLSEQAAASIARRELQRLLARPGLVERGVIVRFTDAVVRAVVREAFDPRYGARSLKRWLEDRVGAWLADEIAGQPAVGMRVLWIYWGEAGLSLHAELLTEAEPEGEAGPFEEMLEWNATRLRERIPGALQELERMLASPRVEALASALRQRLPASVRGDVEAADAVYNLDDLRGELLALRQRLQTQAEYDPRRLEGASAELRTDDESEFIEAQDFGEVRLGGDRWWGDIKVRVLSAAVVGPPLPMSRRPDFVTALAELDFMREALVHADDPAHHTVLIELSRLTPAMRDPRTGEEAWGLLEHLGHGYAERGRGALESWSCDGETTVRPSERDGPSERMVLRLVGPGVRTFFAGEQGSHVREGRATRSEVVRVRVLDGTATPAEHAARLDRERAAFIEALETDARPRPPNPDAMLPVIRRYHYDALDVGGRTRVEAEDYPLAHALEVRGHRLDDVLASLWLLRMGRRPLGGQEQP